MGDLRVTPKCGLTAASDPADPEPFGSVAGGAIRSGAAGSAVGGPPVSDTSSGAAPAHGRDAAVLVGRGWHDVLTKAERRELLQMEDWRSAASVAVDWGLIFAAMALVAWTPVAWLYPITAPLALAVIGSRQLGLAILMHEASHHSLFRSRRWNDWVGSWLCAYPIWADLHAYRPYHLQHHAHTGTERDPDVGLVTPFPITRASFRRKVWRDLTGQTGLSQATAVFLRDIGWRTDGTQRRDDPDVGWRKLAPVAAANAVLLGALAAAGAPALYLLWIGAWLTTYRLVTRIRSIAEHALTPDANDPLRNTRTTLATPLERLFAAPNRVNYHLEHHLMMTVPHYNLPRMHAMLRDRGALDGACVARGYLGVLRNAMARPSF
jgi:fatty acid desaturase